MEYFRNNNPSPVASPLVSPLLDQNSGSIGHNNIPSTLVGNIPTSLVASPQYIQLCIISGFSVTIDYRPKHVDLSKLFQQGQYGQLIHMFPVDNVLVNFNRVQLKGVQVCHICCCFKVMGRIFIYEKFPIKNINVRIYSVMSRVYYLVT